MAAPAQLKLAYFGDDFTGSTDVLEQLARAGLRTMLFIAPPTPAKLQRHAGLDAIGVAGLTRSLAPAAMRATLRDSFLALRALQPRHVHYKVCSTFDSSPTTGSIGCAIEVGAEIFDAGWIPLLVAAPGLGRYCAFGNLFARYGIGSAGEIHRLDRHPAMRQHPVTPADESDLRLHLVRQTTLPIGLVDILAVAAGPEKIKSAVAQLRRERGTIVLFDGIEPTHLASIGAVLEDFASETHPLFSVGSSGIETALTSHWSSRAPVAVARATATGAPLLVVSGSCSPVTAGQIEWALAHDFHGVPLDPGAEASDSVEPIAAALRAGKNVVAYTSRGSATGALVPAEKLGTQLGTLARAVAARAKFTRLVIAGGDTSSYAARALGVESLEFLAPLAPGAPLCRAHAPGSPIDGLEINFKGGQVGAPDYFGAVALGQF